MSKITRATPVWIREFRHVEVREIRTVCAHDKGQSAGIAAMGVIDNQRSGFTKYRVVHDLS